MKNSFYFHITHKIILNKENTHEKVYIDYSVERQTKILLLEANITNYESVITPNNFLQSSSAQSHWAGAIASSISYFAVFSEEVFEQQRD